MTATWTRCTRCIQSAGFPRIRFDADGVCNFCRNLAGAATEDHVIAQAKSAIAQCFAQRDETSQYDALVCYSGGKDSTFALQLAVQKYGLRVLAFTLDNGFLSPAAFDNIYQVVARLGVDLQIFRPSMPRFVDIIRASALKRIYNPRTLTRISSGCNSCISMVNTIALRIAMEMRIPYILAGFTLGQIPANAIIYKNNYRFLIESRQESIDRLKTEVGASVDRYFRIPEKVIAAAEGYPTTINILCVERATEAEIVERVQELGWSSPGDVDGCSSNCMLNTFNNFVHEKSLGYNPYELELSHLIRKGLMSREEALAKIQQQPRQYLEQIMGKLKIDQVDLDGLERIYE